MVTDKITIIYWTVLEYSICRIKGHSQEYNDFQWCKRCYKSFWEELE
jgi:hypothetical protein